jgi:hypothetical protein
MIPQGDMNWYGCSEIRKNLNKQGRPIKNDESTIAYAGRVAPTLPLLAARPETRRRKGYGRARLLLRHTLPGLRRAGSSRA